MWEEESQDERIAVSAGFSDPYLLILRDDSSVLLLHLDTRGDLDEIAVNDTISSQGWLSGCLYQDTKGVICQDSQKESLLFLLSADCKLFVGFKPAHGIFQKTNDVSRYSDCPALKLCL